ARDRAGAPRGADEEAAAQHEDARTAAEGRRVSFEEDGRAALDWVAGYLDRVGGLPVMSRVEPGEIRGALPASPPDEPEPFANVLRDLEQILLPGITHWQSPRFFGFFPNTATDAGILSDLLIAG